MRQPEKEAAGSTGQRVRLIAEAILGRDCVSKLLEWYEEIKNSDYEYVVFVVRRCYLLVIILSKIFNEFRMCIQGEEKTSKTIFLTDAASRLQCRKMADFYRKSGCFPRMLFVDDILIHGRNLNRLIYDMERKIYSELKDMYEADEIRTAFVHAMEIKVFARAKGVLMLREMYERKLRYKMLLPAKEWRELSSNISLLILNADISNACYIFSQHLTEGEFESLRKYPEFSDYEESVYQGTRQYTKVRLLQVGGLVKAIYTLRIIDNNLSDGYRVLPFIFLPELDEVEAKKIFRVVENCIPCKTWLEELYATEEKRSCKELLTMIFSHVLLQEFNDKFNIKRDADTSEDWKEEIEKLTRNYNNVGVDCTLVKDNLKKIINSRLFSENEMDECFITCISWNNYIVEAQWEGRKLTHQEKNEILELEEIFFWKSGRYAEMKAYDYTQRIFLPSKMRSDQEMTAVGDEFQRIFGRYPTKECLRTGTIYFLQLMDAGVVGLTCIEPLGYGAGRFSQFVKYGEQALLYPTVKLYEYIPMLVIMQRKCMETDRNMIDEIELLDQSGFMAQEGLEFNKDDIIQYVEDLEVMGHRVVDWSGNFYQRKALAEPGKTTFTVRWLFEFKDLQNKYVNTYMEYLKTRGC